MSADPSDLALDPDDWRRILDALEGVASYHTIVDVLSDARQTSRDRAKAALDAALDAGTLDERDTGMIFDEVVLTTDDQSKPQPQAPNPGETAETDHSPPEPEHTDIPTPEAADSWADVEFPNPDNGVYPPELLQREQWMGRQDKLPFAPWADRDADVQCTKDHAPDTCADCSCDARYKWGHPGNYLDGHAVALAEDDPRLDGRVFLQQDDDPYAFVDGDDVRDPETGDVHPAFRAILEHLGITYADVSTSGTGVHAYYRGEIPGDGPQAAFEIDTEPWGANDDVPAIEIYANKHVNVATGDHLPGTPTDLNGWDHDALEAILEATDQLQRRPDPSDRRDDFDSHHYDPDATTADDTATDIRDLFTAIDHLNVERVARQTIVREWNDAASTGPGNRAFYPEWGPNSNGTATYVDTDQAIYVDTGDHGATYGGPVAMAVIDDPTISADETDVEGEPDGELWWRGVEHLRDDLNFSIPEYEPDSSTDPRDEDTVDPRDRNVVIDPHRAWEAAELVEPTDLDDDATPLDVRADPDAGHWRAPDGTALTVVRAVALAEGIIDAAGHPLDRDRYDRAYRRARDVYGAPLPEYLDKADATENFQLAMAALREASFWHLDQPAIRSEITATGNDVSGDAVRALDPVWRDSDSGRSVLVFESGTVYDAATDTTIDPVRFVALETGLLEEPTAAFGEGQFKAAYDAARTHYGVNLPAWLVGDPDHTPVLPAPDALVEDLDPDESDIEATWSRVEELYRELAGDTGDDGPRANVLRTLPGTGKTTSAIKSARDIPASYLAGRNELKQQAAETADQFGVTWKHLPVFAEESLTEDALTAAVAHVRENGHDTLRDPDALLEAVDHATGLSTDDTDDDTDAVDLDRESCPTADGDHGDAIALAVHTARELGWKPRQIHVRDRELFGRELPCRCDGDCDYTDGWEDARDPDDPYDLLIGSEGHAHVGSVRSYVTRDGDQRRDVAPRTVILDEYPGEAFADRFDEEFVDHAVWVASALRDDVEDRQALHETDLWGDEWVRRWLRGDGTENDAAAALAEELESLARVVGAVLAADRLLNDVPGYLENQGLRHPLLNLVERFPFEHAPAVTDTYDMLRDRAEDPAEGSIARDIQENVLTPLASFLSDWSGEKATTVGVDDAPISGDLQAFVDDALEAAREQRDGAAELLGAAADAIRGGRKGCEELAAHAYDGYAHPLAYLLLHGLIAPDGADAPAKRIETPQFAFDESDDGAVLKWLQRQRRIGDDDDTLDTVLTDRNHNGAIVKHPPEFRDLEGDPVPVVGLDATGRERLWAESLGVDVDGADIHDTPRERARFLRETMDLQVVQTTDDIKSYSNPGSGNALRSDAALLERIRDRYAGRRPGQRGVDALGKPAVITTKSAENYLEELAGDAVDTFDHYGDVKGDNDLGDHQLAAVVGAQHYGDDAVEKTAALAGEEVHRSGHGTTLEYGSETADAYLKHMRRDQVMQALLRFTRGDSGAIVFAHTGALRDDVPVVGRGDIVRTWKRTATQAARVARDLDADEFTARDVVDAGEFDVTAKSVRRGLNALAEEGYLDVDRAEGVANTYGELQVPPDAEVDLPGELATPRAGSDPDNSRKEEHYMWNVRASTDDPPGTAPATRSGSILPAPDASDGDPIDAEAG